MSALNTAGSFNMLSPWPCQISYLASPTNNRRRQRVGKQIRTRLLTQHLDELLGSGGVTTCKTQLTILHEYILSSPDRVGRKFRLRSRSQ